MTPATGASTSTWKWRRSIYSLARGGRLTIADIPANIEQFCLSDELSRCLYSRSAPIINISAALLHLRSDFSKFATIPSSSASINAFASEFVLGSKVFTIV